MTARHLIRQLPPEVANQIAAGEVDRAAGLGGQGAGRERPRCRRASRRDHDRAGRQGDWSASRTTASACRRTTPCSRCERHATSKIATADDLAAIRTLGFRGEALPSHRLGVALRAADAGARQPVRHGDSRRWRSGGRRRAKSARPRARASRSRDLFYNLPARRKFLKADAAESAQISRLVTQIALGYPTSASTLVSAGRRVLHVRRRRRCATGSTRCYGERPGPDRAVPRVGGHPRHRLRGGAGRTGAGARRRSTSSSTAASSATRRSRTRSPTPTAPRRSASAAPRCICSSSWRRTGSTSTCTRPRRRCGSSSRAGARGAAARR